MNEYIKAMYEEFLSMFREYPISWVSEAYEMAEKEYILQPNKEPKLVEKGEEE